MDIYLSDFFCLKCQMNKTVTQLILLICCGEEICIDCHLKEHQTSLCSFCKTPIDYANLTKECLHSFEMIIRCALKGEVESIKVIEKAARHGQPAAQYIMFLLVFRGIITRAKMEICYFLICSADQNYKPSQEVMNRILVSAKNGNQKSQVLLGNFKKLILMKNKH